MTAHSASLSLGHALGFSDPEVILSTLRQLYQEVDQKVEAGSKDIALPCHKGCDACCHESVFLSAPEFLFAANHIFENFSQAERTKLVTEMIGLAASFADELELLEELTPGKERDEVAARIKFRCPLLSTSGLCRIYPARELNARTFGLSWDSLHARPFGCELTHERLQILGHQDLKANLFDARNARRMLMQKCPNTDVVHVYPWWFRHYADYFS